MKLYAKQVGAKEWNLAWDNIPDRFDEDKNPVEYESPSHKKEDGWYPIEREPDRQTEYLEYDEKADCIVIKKREKSTEVLEAERAAKIKQQLKDELPDLILQNKDSPEQLVAALCDRAKQIEVETKIEAKLERETS